MSARTTLPNGTTNQGPPINSTYPLGAYIEDYEFITGLGQLDAHNGRTTKTPEFPNGTYAYFITVDANMGPIYPYILGPSLYGVVDQQGVFGPGGNNYTVPVTATLYVPDTTTTGLSPEQVDMNNALNVYPNPASSVLNVKLTGFDNISLNIYSFTGQLLHNEVMQNTLSSININEYAPGLYLLNIQNNISGTVVSKRIIKQ
jgi:hypothetical protein